MNGTSAGDREAEIRRLRRERPRRRFVRLSVAAMALIAIGSWRMGGFDFVSLMSARHLANLDRFVGELRPYPLQGAPWDWGTALRWVGEVMAAKGGSGALATLAISVAAIVLAALAALALTLPATRSVAHAEPYLPGPRPPGAASRWLWRSMVAVTRAALIFVRSIPEYLWAFLLIALVGPGAWPAVLALTIHNSGILGRLSADVVENLPPAPLVALRGLGAGRCQIAAVGVLPAVVPRLLLFVFYRWETCVREATVLGMLGIVSLGFWIQDARARNHYDEMFLLILLGSVIVLAGDLVSALARRAVRRAG